MSHYYISAITSYRIDGQIQLSISLVSDPVGDKHCFERSYNLVHGGLFFTLFGM